MTQRECRDGRARHTVLHVSDDCVTVQRGVPRIRRLTLKRPASGIAGVDDESNLKPLPVASPPLSLPDAYAPRQHECLDCGHSIPSSVYMPALPEPNVSSTGTEPAVLALVKRLEDGGHHVRTLQYMASCLSAWRKRFPFGPCRPEIINCMKEMLRRYGCSACVPKEFLSVRRDVVIAMIAAASDSTALLKDVSDLITSLLALEVDKSVAGVEDALGDIALLRDAATTGTGKVRAF
jgi:hypothetical protein